METLEHKFLESSGILKNVKKSLSEIGFPADPDRYALIETQIEQILSQFIDPRYIESLIAFFESEAGKMWTSSEMNVLQEIEKVVIAHISYARGDEMLRELGLIHQSSEDESDIPDSQKH